jgi:hypothetical protein
MESLSIWYGSRNLSPGQLGSSHLNEHTTAENSSPVLAENAAGGFISHEITCAEEEASPII